LDFFRFTSQVEDLSAGNQEKGHNDSNE